MKTRIRGALCALSVMLMAGWPLGGAMAQDEPVDPPLPKLVHLPMVLPVSNTGIEGFVRVVNQSGESGRVDVSAWDDAGNTNDTVAVWFELPANGAVHFSSRDLEGGNAAKGLTGALGDGEGDWRLHLQTDLNIWAMAYVRTADGFVTPVHDTARGDELVPAYHVLFFNPASNRSQRSRLRLSNEGYREAATVTVAARDDRGECAPGGVVRLTLQGGQSRTLSAVDLENGGADLSGRLGDGAGKWRLFVTSSGPIDVMSLLASPTGHLTNLSTALVAEYEEGSAMACGG